MTGSLRSTNLVSIAGALVAVFSLICPWFRLEFSITSGSLAGFQLLSGWISGSRHLETLTGISMLFLVFSSGTVLLAAQRNLSAALAVASAALLAVALWLNPVPVASYGWGVWMAAAGLVMMATSVFRKEEEEEEEEEPRRPEA